MTRRIYIKVFGLEAMLAGLQWHSDNKKLERLLNAVSQRLIERNFSVLVDPMLLAQMTVEVLGGEIVKVTGKDKPLPPDLIV